MARSIIFVNTSGSPWSLNRFGGLLVPAAGTLNATELLSDDELIAEIQKGLGAEFDASHYLRIGGVDKTADESRGFLTPGQPGGSALLMANGAIDDAQHGTRGAGTLHPAADGANPGFLTAADYTKLAGIGPGSRPEVSAAMGDSNGPGVSTSSQTPVIERYVIFPGTNVWTPTIFKVVAQTSNNNIGYNDVYDVTNGQIIATVSFAGATPQLISTATLANLPVGQAILAFRAYRGGASTTVTTFFAILTRT